MFRVCICGWVAHLGMFITPCEYGALVKSIENNGKLVSSNMNNNGGCNIESLGIVVSGEPLCVTDPDSFDSAVEGWGDANPGGKGTIDIMAAPHSKA